MPIIWLPAFYCVKTKFKLIKAASYWNKNHFEVQPISNWGLCFISFPGDVLFQCFAGAVLQNYLGQSKFWTVFMLSERWIRTRYLCLKSKQPECEWNKVINNYVSVCLLKLDFQSVLRKHESLKIRNLKQNEGEGREMTGSLIFPELLQPNCHVYQPALFIHTKPLIKSWLDSRPGAKVSAGQRRRPGIHMQVQRCLP